MMVGGLAKCITTSKKLGKRRTAGNDAVKTMDTSQEKDFWEKFKAALRNGRVSGSEEARKLSTRIQACIQNDGLPNSLLAPGSGIVQAFGLRVLPVAMEAVRDCSASHRLQWIW